MLDVYRDLPVVEHMERQFAGELGQLTGARAYVDGTAVGGGVP